MLDYVCSVNSECCVCALSMYPYSDPHTNQNSFALSKGMPLGSRNVGHFGTKFKLGSFESGLIPNAWFCFKSLMFVISQVAS